MGIPSLDLGTRQSNRSFAPSVTKASCLEVEVISDFLNKEWGKRYSPSQEFGHGFAAKKFRELLLRPTFWGARCRSTLKMSPSMSRSFASNTLAVVPVRAGSRACPKNVRLIAGKPLYQHAVEQALRLVGKCVVTTDIVEILNSPSISGETLVERPSEIA